MKVKFWDYYCDEKGLVTDENGDRLENRGSVYTERRLFAGPSRNDEFDWFISMSSGRQPNGYVQGATVYLKLDELTKFLEDNEVKDILSKTKTAV